MNTIRTIVIALPVILLMGCGGGGGGSSNTATPTTTTTPVNPLAGLANFESSTGHSTIETIQEVVNPDGIVVNTSVVFEAGNLNFVSALCFPTANACTASFPGAGNPVTFRKDNLTDISLITNNAFFSDSTYSSEITNGITIEGITFARGRLTGTRAVDSTPLEFESFAGWLDGNIFGTIQVTIGASGSEQQYRFISYGAGSYDDSNGNPTATGSEPTTATWKGRTVASIKDSRTFILGDATITIHDLANADVDLEFDNWRGLDNQELPDMDPITFEDAKLGNGRFSLMRDNITEAFGRFYGDGHTGVGGWFNTETVTGAFGATRQ